MDRRSIIVAALALIAGTIVSAHSTPAPGRSPTEEQQPDQRLFDPRRPPDRELELSIGDGFTLAAVGDCIISRPLSALLKTDAGFAGAARIVREAEVAFGNLETPIVDLRSFKGSPQGGWDDWPVSAEPGVAADLKALGFDLLARANNHALDWGVEGMRETSRLLDEAGLVHAGVGESRAEARGARYLETERGRVALVSMASTYRELSNALPPYGQAPGRPGVNAVRWKRTTLVTESMMRALRDLKGAIDAGSESCSAKPARPVPAAPPVPAPPLELTLFDQNFRVGERPAYHYDVDPQDLAENLKAIRQGKQHSDFLIATIHAHENEIDCERPGDFLPPLAHAAIDAGADIFLLHGPHTLGPIEIYKGRLVFYGLGDFFFSDIQEPISADLYEQSRDLLKEALGDPARATDADLNALLNAGYFNDAIFFQSVIAVSRYDERRLSEVRLYPVDLGYGTILTRSGVPRLASPSVGRTILDRLQRLSRPYGTTIAIEKGVGVIRPH
ncbi:MAG TPA: CapA family protein [Candidatus Polarisedimenticolia bacterium]|nr:CapA family protein [Candidatus Polarisedimenticolia bacterium]